MSYLVTCLCGKQIQPSWMLLVEPETDYRLCPSCVLERYGVEELYRLEAMIRDECQRRIEQLEEVAYLVEEWSMSGIELWPVLMGMQAADVDVSRDVINIADAWYYYGEPDAPWEVVADKLRRRADVLRIMRMGPTEDRGAVAEPMVDQEAKAEPSDSGSSPCGG